MDTRSKVILAVIDKAKKDKELRQTLNIPNLLQSSLPYSLPIVGLKIAIIGYTIDLVPPWDPFSCETGLTGSEECVVYASETLANEGNSVTLYMNPPIDSIWRSSLSNPRWLHESEWYKPENKEEYDLVLMWRRFDVNTGRQRGKIVFYWPHDSPQADANKYQFPNFDGVLPLSQHHYNQLSVMPGFSEIPFSICGNGLVSNQFSSPMSFANPYSIGYFSNYARGLKILLMIWPDIYKKFPLATLDIYYGRETWNILTEDEMKQLVDTINSYKTIGVTERGKVGHQQLANAMQQTSIWCYPCITEGETFCITAAKCQAAGCIPVTTRIGALNETIHSEAPSIPLINTMEDVEKFRELLLETLSRIQNSDPELLKEERQKYIDYGRKYTWESCVTKWLELYEHIK